ncbi:META domain-containing protein [Deinococcus cavernae]|uniref:META domain-containing protein n=1 Tax=Deinococcus cavernae TaxID=2320857 RepID=A0A418VBE4_9DEIO|nr:META domain-containing protein [Deinococcus cavernae]RJF73417.1 META domain-containing protein [Deinococcus cavernae]
MKMLVLAALLLTSARAAAPNSPPLTGTVWTMTQIAPQGKALTPGARLRRPTFRVMPGGLLTGWTGCQGFSGWATVKGRTMRVTPLKLSGTSDCPDHALSLEADFLNLLQSARRFEIRGQTLTLYSEGKRFMNFQGSTGGKSVTDNPPPSASLQGDWQLTTLLHRGQPVKLSEKAAFTIGDTAAGLELRGNAGCNQLFGKVVVQGRTLSVSALGMTMMLCQDMAAETAVVDILGIPVAVTWNGDTVTWRNSRGELTLTRAGRPEAALRKVGEKDVQGRTFTLKTVAGQPLGRTVKPVTVQFGAGRVSGSDGCNSFSGSAEWRGGRVTVGALALTRMACPGMDRVPSLPEFLGSSPSAQLDGDTLRLSAEGATWTFTAQP